MKQILLFILMMGTVPLQAAQEDSDIQISTTTALTLGVVALPLVGYIGYRAGEYMRRKADKLFFNAVGLKNHKRAEFCLDALGCDPNRLSSPYDLHGLPLHLAVENDDATMVDLLLKRGACDCYDLRGIPGLQKCSVNGMTYNPSIVVALLEAHNARKDEPHNHCDNAHDTLAASYKEYPSHFYEKAKEDRELQRQGKPFSRTFSTPTCVELNTIIDFSSGRPVFYYMQVEDSDDDEGKKDL